MNLLVPYYAALFVGIAIATSGQILLKSGAVRSGDVVTQFLNPYTLVGLVAYGLAAGFYIVAIKKIPISIAYPTVSLSYAVVAIAAHYLWDERIGWAQIVGILLIWAGIFVLNRG